MTDENTLAPENQDTPPEKLYGGKYKTPEELEAAYQESVRVQSQIAEENDRMQRYIALMDQPPAQPNNDVPPNGEEDEIPEPVKRYVHKQLTVREQKILESGKIEKLYFSKYPDHEGEQDLVLFHAMKFNQENAGRHIPVEKRVEEVGRRVQIHMDRIRKADKTPPHVEGGSSAGRPARGAAPKAPESEEERLRAFIAESKRQKNKTMGKG